MSKGKLITGGIAAALTLAVPLVAKWEGKRNDPYFDVIAVRTVCFGETHVPMRRYSDAECVEMLKQSLGGYAQGVLMRNPNLADRPYQLAAASSLAYNIGPAAYARSTVARRFTQGDFKGACDAFLMFVRAGGKVLPGLVRRRQDERRVCLSDL